MAERDPISGSSRDYGATAAPPTVGFSDFSPTELFNLSEGIADNANTVNSGLRALEKMMKQIGGPNDNVQLREKIHECQQRVNACASDTARDLQRLRVLARRGERPQKLQAERLTQAFMDALERYSAVQKEVTAAMAAHMPRAPRPPLDAAAAAQADDEEAALIANQQAQARLVQFETSMLAEREAQLSRAEADAQDVAQIMRDLSAMVHAQGQTVDSVLSHVEDADARVEAGVDELAKAAQHQRSYRRKMFILTLIGLVLAIIIVVWIVKAFR